MPPIEIAHGATRKSGHLGVQKSRLQESEAAIAATVETRAQTVAEFRRTLLDELNKAEAFCCTQIARQKVSGLSWPHVAFAARAARVTFKPRTPVEHLPSFLLSAAPAPACVRIRPPGCHRRSPPPAVGNRTILRRCSAAFLPRIEKRARARLGRWRRGLCDAVFGCGGDLARAGRGRFYNHINGIGSQ
jgi:hypothetical protein